MTNYLFRFTVISTILAASSAGGQESDRVARTAATWRAAAQYDFTHVSGGLSAWHAGLAEIARRAPQMTVVGRMNVARRFDLNGAQVEVDAYPHLSPRVYAYLNAGYSSSHALFPDWRFGGELYTSAGSGGELSLGLRRLMFSASNVTIYTGSAGLYSGNYYLSFRPYVSPVNGKTAVSGTLLLRRYFADADSYITFVGGAGSAPSESPLEFELSRQNSARIGAYGKWPLSPSTLWLRWNALYEHERLTRTVSRDRATLGAGFEIPL